MSDSTSPIAHDDMIFPAPSDRISQNVQPKSLWRLRSVMAVTGLSRSSIYELVSKGNFPKQIGYYGCVGWVSTEVQAWVDQQIAANRNITPENANENLVATAKNSKENLQTTLDNVETTP